MAEELNIEHFDLGTFVDYVYALKQERDALRAQLHSQGGEAVAWMNVATGCVTSLPVVVMDWDDEGEEVQSLYPHPANAPTDSRVVPVELLERATNFGRPDVMEIALGEIRALLELKP